MHALHFLGLCTINTMYRSGFLLGLRGKLVFGKSTKESGQHDLIKSSEGLKSCYFILISVIEKNYFK